MFAMGAFFAFGAGDATDPVGTVASTSPYAAYSRPTLEAITTYFALELVG